MTDLRTVLPSVAHLMRLTAAAARQMVRRAGFIRPVAILTLVCFVYTSIGAPCVEGAIELSKTTRAHDQLKATLTSGNPSFDIDLPMFMGRITGGDDCGGDVLVVNIQDLHCHAEVQRNISRIIGFLDKKYRLKKVYVEGGYGDIDVSLLNAVADPALRTSVIESLVDNGRLTGGEHYAMTSGRSDLLSGLEDERLHKANIVRLGKMLEKRPDYDRALHLLNRDLDLMKAKYLTVKNKRFNTLLARYKTGKIDTTRYYQLLNKYIATINRHPEKYHNILPLRAESFPAIQSFLAVSSMQKHIDFDRVASQLREFTLLLQSHLPKAVYNDLLAKTDNLADTDALYAMLARMIKEYKLDTRKGFPELTAFFAYMEMSQAINPNDLVNEEHRLVNELRAAFSQDIAELEVSFLCDFYACFEDYLLNRLSAKDYDYFLARFGKFQTTWGKYTYKNHLLDLSADFPLIDAYYADNERRNAVFFDNFFTRNPARDPRNRNPSAREVIVVVSGGFHTDGIARLLKERTISYCTITPRVTQAPVAANAIYDETAVQQASYFEHAALGPEILAEIGPDAVKVTGNNVSINAFGVLFEVKDGKFSSNERRALSRAAQRTAHERGLDYQKVRRQIILTLGSLTTRQTPLQIIPGLYNALEAFGDALTRVGITGRGLLFRIASDEGVQKALADSGYTLEQLSNWPSPLQGAAATYAEAKARLESIRNHPSTGPVLKAVLTVPGVIEILAGTVSRAANPRRALPWWHNIFPGGSGKSSAAPRRAVPGSQADAQRRQSDASAAEAADAAVRAAINAQHRQWVKPTPDEQALLSSLDTSVRAYLGKLGIPPNPITNKVQDITAFMMLAKNIVKLTMSGGKTIAIVKSSALKLLQWQAADQSGRGVLVFNNNHELAKRDAGINAEIRAGAGLPVKVAALTTDDKGNRGAIIYYTDENGRVAEKTATREEAYRTCDIIYCVAADVIHDNQSEQRATSPDKVALRNKKWFVIADEADRTLAAEAETPFITSSGELKDTPARIELTRQAEQIVSGADGRPGMKADKQSYFTVEGQRAVTLTPRGRKIIRDYAKQLPADVDRKMLEQYVITALNAHLFHERSNDYLRVTEAARDEDGNQITADRIILINKATGARSDRKLSHGLWQAIEAKEGLGEITPEQETVAEDTIFSFLGSEIIEDYAGCSGTVPDNVFPQVFGKQVKVVETTAGASATEVGTFLSATAGDSLSLAAKEAFDRWKLKHSVIVRVSSPEAGAQLQALIQKMMEDEHVGASSRERILRVDAENIEQMSRLSKLGVTPHIAICTNLVTRGVDIQTKFEGDKADWVQGMSYISAFVDASAFEASQGEARVGRSSQKDPDGNPLPSYVMTYGSLQDDIITESPLITQEAEDILGRRLNKAQGVQLNGKEKQTIARLRAVLLSQKIEGTKSIKKRGAFVAALQEEFNARRTALRDNGILGDLDRNTRVMIRQSMPGRSDKEIDAVLTAAAVERMNTLETDFLTTGTQIWRRMQQFGVDYQYWQKLWQIGLDVLYNRSVKNRHRQRMAQSTTPALIGAVVPGLAGTPELSALGKSTRSVDRPLRHRVVNSVGVLIASAGLISLSSTVMFLASGIKTVLTSIGSMYMFSFGLSAIAGPALFIAGGAAFMMVIGTIALKKVFLDRIQHARSTGDALNMFITGADRSKKGFMAAARDIPYTFSSVIVYSSMLGAVGVLASAAVLNMPFLLFSSPVIAAIGLVSAGLTAFAGRKHVNANVILPVEKSQRLATALGAGFLVAAIIAFVTTTQVLAVPLAALSAIVLTASAIAAFYVLPARFGGDRIINYRFMLGAMVAGLVLGGGILAAFGLGVISTAWLVTAGTWIFVAGGVAAVTAGIWSAVALGSIFASAEGKRSYFGVTGSTLLVNMAKIVPVVMLFAFGGASYQILIPIVAAMVGFIAIARRMPKSVKVVAGALGLGMAVSMVAGAAPAVAEEDDSSSEDSDKDAEEAERKEREAAEKAREEAEQAAQKAKEEAEERERAQERERAAEREQERAEENAKKAERAADKAENFASQAEDAGSLSRAKRYLNKAIGAANDAKRYAGKADGKASGAVSRANQAVERARAAVRAAEADAEAEAARQSDEDSDKGSSSPSDTNTKPDTSSSDSDDDAAAERKAQEQQNAWDEAERRAAGHVSNAEAAANKAGTADSVKDAREFYNKAVRELNAAKEDAKDANGKAKDEVRRAEEAVSRAKKAVERLANKKLSSDDNQSSSVSTTKDAAPDSDASSSDSASPETAPATPSAPASPRQEQTSTPAPEQDTTPSPDAPEPDKNPSTNAPAPTVTPTQEAAPAPDNTGVEQQEATPSPNDTATGQPETATPSAAPETTSTPEAASAQQEADAEAVARAQLDALKRSLPAELDQQTLDRLGYPDSTLLGLLKDNTEAAVIAEILTEYNKENTQETGVDQVTDTQLNELKGNLPDYVREKLVALGFNDEKLRQELSTLGNSADMVISAILKKYDEIYGNPELEKFMQRINNDSALREALIAIGYVNLDDQSALKDLLRRHKDDVEGTIRYVKDTYKAKLDADLAAKSEAAAIKFRQMIIDRGLVEEVKAVTGVDVRTASLKTIIEVILYAEWKDDNGNKVGNNGSPETAIQNIVAKYKADQEALVAEAAAREFIRMVIDGGHAGKVYMVTGINVRTASLRTIIEKILYAEWKDANGNTVGNNGDPATALRNILAKYNTDRIAQAAEAAAREFKQMVIDGGHAGKVLKVTGIDVRTASLRTIIEKILYAEWKDANGNTVGNNGDPATALKNILAKWAEIQKTEAVNAWVTAFIQKARATPGAAAALRELYNVDIYSARDRQRIIDDILFGGGKKAGEIRLQNKNWSSVLDDIVTYYNLVSGVRDYFNSNSAAADAYENLTGKDPRKMSFKKLEAFVYNKDGTLKAPIREQGDLIIHAHAYLKELRAIRVSPVFGPYTGAQALRQLTGMDVGDKGPISDEEVLKFLFDQMFIAPDEKSDNKDVQHSEAYLRPAEAAEYLVRVQAYASVLQTTMVSDGKGGQISLLDRMNSSLTFLQGETMIGKVSYRNRLVPGEFNRANMEFFGRQMYSALKDAPDHFVEVGLQGGHPVLDAGGHILNVEGKAITDVSGGEIVFAQDGDRWISTDDAHRYIVQSDGSIVLMRSDAYLEPVKAADALGHAFKYLDTVTSETYEGRDGTSMTLSAKMNRTIGALQLDRNGTTLLPETAGQEYDLPDIEFAFSQIFDNRGEPNAWFYDSQTAINSLRSLYGFIDQSQETVVVLDQQGNPIKDQPNTINPWERIKEQYALTHQGEQLNATQMNQNMMTYVNDLLYELRLDDGKTYRPDGSNDIFGHPYPRPLKDANGKDVTIEIKDKKVVGTGKEMPGFSDGTYYVVPTKAYSDPDTYFQNMGHMYLMWDSIKNDPESIAYLNTWLKEHEPEQYGDFPLPTNPGVALSGKNIQFLYSLLYDIQWTGDIRILNFVIIPGVVPVAVRSKYFDDPAAFGRETALKSAYIHTVYTQNANIVIHVPFVNWDWVLPITGLEAMKWVYGDYWHDNAIMYTREGEPALPLLNPVGFVQETLHTYLGRNPHILAVPLILLYVILKRLVRISRRLGSVLSTALFPAHLPFNNTTIKQLEKVLIRAAHGMNVPLNENESKLQKAQAHRVALLLAALSRNGEKLPAATYSEDDMRRNLSVLMGNNAEDVELVMYALQHELIRVDNRESIDPYKRQRVPLFQDAALQAQLTDTDAEVVVTAFFASASINDTVAIIQDLHARKLIETDTLAAIIRNSYAAGKSSTLSEAHQLNYIFDSVNADINNTLLTNIVAIKDQPGLSAFRKLLDTYLPYPSVAVLRRLLDENIITIENIGDVQDIVKKLEKNAGLRVFTDQLIRRLVYNGAFDRVMDALPNDFKTLKMYLSATRDKDGKGRNKTDQAKEDAFASILPIIYNDPALIVNSGGHVEVNIQVTHPAREVQSLTELLLQYFLQQNYTITNMRSLGQTSVLPEVVVYYARMIAKRLDDLSRAQHAVEEYLSQQSLTADSSALMLEISKITDPSVADEMIEAGITRHVEHLNKEQMVELKKRLQNLVLARQSYDHINSILTGTRVVRKLFVRGVQVFEVVTKRRQTTTPYALKDILYDLDIMQMMVDLGAQGLDVFALTPAEAKDYFEKTLTQCGFEFTDVTAADGIRTVSISRNEKQFSSIDIFQAINETQQDFMAGAAPKPFTQYKKYSQDGFIPFSIDEFGGTARSLLDNLNEDLSQEGVRQFLLAALIRLGKDRDFGDMVTKPEPMPDQQKAEQLVTDLKETNQRVIDLLNVLMSDDVLEVYARERGIPSFRGDYPNKAILKVLLPALFGDGVAINDAPAAAAVFESMKQTEEMRLLMALKEDQDKLYRSTNSDPTPLPQPQGGLLKNGLGQLYAKRIAGTYIHPSFWFDHVWRMFSSVGLTALFGVAAALAFTMLPAAINIDVALMLGVVALVLPPIIAGRAEKSRKTNGMKWSIAALFTVFSAYWGGFLGAFFVRGIFLQAGLYAIPGVNILMGIGFVLAGALLMLSSTKAKDMRKKMPLFIAGLFALVGPLFFIPGLFTYFTTTITFVVLIALALPTLMSFWHIMIGERARAIMRIQNWSKVQAKVHERVGTQIMGTILATAGMMSLIAFDHVPIPMLISGVIALAVGFISIIQAKKHEGTGKQKLMVIAGYGLIAGGAVGMTIFMVISAATASWLGWMAIVTAGIGLLVILFSYRHRLGGMHTAGGWERTYTAQYEEFLKVERTRSVLLPTGEPVQKYFMRLIQSLPELSIEEKEAWMKVLHGKEGGHFVRPESGHARDVLQAAFIALSAKSIKEGDLMRIEAMTTHIQAFGEEYNYLYETITTPNSFQGKYTQLGYYARNYAPEWSAVIRSLSNEDRLARSVIAGTADTRAEEADMRVIKQYLALMAEIDEHSPIPPFPPVTTSAGRSYAAEIRRSIEVFFNRRNGSSGSGAAAMARSNISLHLALAYRQGLDGHPDTAYAEAIYDIVYDLNNADNSWYQPRYQSLQEAYQALSARDINTLTATEQYFLSRYQLYQDQAAIKQRYIIHHGALAGLGLVDLQDDKIRGSIVLTKLSYIKDALIEANIPKDIVDAAFPDLPGDGQHDARTWARDFTMFRDRYLSEIQTVLAARKREIDALTFDDLRSNPVFLSLSSMKKAFVDEKIPQEIVDAALPDLSGENKLNAQQWAQAFTVFRERYPNETKRVLARQLQEAWENASKMASIINDTNAMGVVSAINHKADSDVGAKNPGIANNLHLFLGRAVKMWDWGSNSLHGQEDFDLFLVSRVMDDPTTIALNPSMIIPGDKGTPVRGYYAVGQETWTGVVQMAIWSAFYGKGIGRKEFLIAGTTWPGEDTASIIMAQAMAGVDQDKRLKELRAELKDRGITIRITNGEVRFYNSQNQQMNAQEQQDLAENEGVKRYLLVRAELLKLRAENLVHGEHTVRGWMEWSRPTFVETMLTTEMRYGYNVSRYFYDPMLFKVFFSKSVGWDLKMTNLMLWNHYLLSPLVILLAVALTPAIMFSSYAFILPVFVAILISTLLTEAINYSRIVRLTQKHGDFFAAVKQTLPEILHGFFMWVAIIPFTCLGVFNAALEKFAFLPTKKGLTLGTHSFAERYATYMNTISSFGLWGILGLGAYLLAYGIFFFLAPATLLSLGLGVLIVPMIYYFASVSWITGPNAYQEYKNGQPKARAAARGFDSKDLRVAWFKNALRQRRDVDHMLVDALPALSGRKASSEMSTEEYNSIVDRLTAADISTALNALLVKPAAGTIAGSLAEKMAKDKQLTDVEKLTFEERALVEGFGTATEIPDLNAAQTTLLKNATKKMLLYAYSASVRKTAIKGESYREILSFASKLYFLTPFLFIGYILDWLVIGLTQNMRHSIVLLILRPRQSKSRVLKNNFYSKDMRVAWFKVALSQTSDDPDRDEINSMVLNSIRANTESISPDNEIIAGLTSVDISKALNALLVEPKAGEIAGRMADKMAGDMRLTEEERTLLSNLAAISDEQKPILRNVVKKMLLHVYNGGVRATPVLGDSADRVHRDYLRQAYMKLVASMVRRGPNDKLPPPETKTALPESIDPIVPTAPAAPVVDAPSPAAVPAAVNEPVISAVEAAPAAISERVQLKAQQLEAAGIPVTKTTLKYSPATLIERKNAIEKRMGRAATTAAYTTNFKRVFPEIFNLLYGGTTRTEVIAIVYRLLSDSSVRQLARNERMKIARRVADSVMHDMRMDMQPLTEDNVRVRAEEAVRQLLSESTAQEAVSETAPTDAFVEQVATPAADVARSVVPALAVVDETAQLAAEIGKAGLAAVADDTAAGLPSGMAPIGGEAVIEQSATVPAQPRAAAGETAISPVSPAVKPEQQKRFSMRVVRQWVARLLIPAILATFAGIGFAYFFNARQYGESNHPRITASAAPTGTAPAERVAQNNTSGVQRTTASGYELIVHYNQGPAEVNNIRGVAYSVDQEGRSFGQHYKTDISLMVEAGVNTIRTYRPLAIYNTDKSINYKETKKMLDAFANAGISVQVGFDLNNDVNTGIYKDYISAFRAHGAILGWVFGNEYNYHYGEWFSQEQWMTELTKAVKEAKALDKNHVVMTVHGEMPSLNDIKAYKKAGVDVIGINIYRGSLSGVAESWAELVAKSPLPLVIAETGRGSRMANGRSTEDAQAAIIDNALTEAVNGRRTLAGVYVFEFRDEPWKGGESNSAIGREDSLGLVTVDGQKKSAFQVLVRLWKQTPVSSGIPSASSPATQPSGSPTVTVDVTGKPVPSSPQPSQIFIPLGVLLGTKRRPTATAPKAPVSQDRQPDPLMQPAQDEAQQPAAPTTTAETAPGTDVLPAGEYQADASARAAWAEALDQLGWMKIFVHGRRELINLNTPVAPRLAAAAGMLVFVATQAFVPALAVGVVVAGIALGITALRRHASARVNVIYNYISREDLIKNMEDLKVADVDLRGSKVSVYVHQTPEGNLAELRDTPGTQIIPLGAVPVNAQGAVDQLYAAVLSDGKLILSFPSESTARDPKIIAAGIGKALVSANGLGGNPAFIRGMTKATTLSLSRRADHLAAVKEQWKDMIFAQVMAIDNVNTQGKVRVGDGGVMWVPEEVLNSYPGMTQGQVLEKLSTINVMAGKCVAMDTRDVAGMDVTKLIQQTGTVSLIMTDAALQELKAVWGEAYAERIAALRQSGKLLYASEPVTRQQAAQSGISGYFETGADAKAHLYTFDDTGAPVEQACSVIAGSVEQLAEQLDKNRDGSVAVIQLTGILNPEGHMANMHDAMDAIYDHVFDLVNANGELERMIERSLNHRGTEDLLRAA